MNFHGVMHPNDADGMANSVDPDQTAPLGVNTVSSDLSVRKFRNIMVESFYEGEQRRTKIDIS